MKAKALMAGMVLMLGVMGSPVAVAVEFVVYNMHGKYHNTYTNLAACKRVAEQIGGWCEVKR